MQPAQPPGPPRSPGLPRSPAAVVWRRLDLQGDIEHLRWLLPPAGTAAGGRPGRRR